MLVSMALLAMLMVAGSQLLATMLASESGIRQSDGLQPDAQRAMQTLVEAVSTTTHLHVPNGRCRDTSLMVLSANIDNDGDGRIDEDPSASLFGSAVGAVGIDDDCDGLADESLFDDDDEDGFLNEDRRDGIDNDGDGSIDEDPSADANGDGWAGAHRVDDDGDGTPDEGAIGDDDEDGLVDEDGADLRKFCFDAATHTLYEQSYGDVIPLLQGVQQFDVHYLTGAGGEPLVEIHLRIGPGGPDDMDLTTRVFPANLTAKHGFTNS
jgi:hypothetical protein